MSRTLPTGFNLGPLQGRNVIGEVTESLHKFLIDGWSTNTPPPRIEEDLSFIPKDREEVLYVYMYRVAENTALQNSKRLREARVSMTGSASGEPELFYERPPLYLDLHYMIAVHSKFRSDAERLMGWLLLRLHEATHLLYRPRRFVLPDGREVDSMGRPWKVDATGGADLIMEKVALALLDDMTVGDAINFFTIHEAPYRPYLTYRARCAMEGALISAPTGTTVKSLPLERHGETAPTSERPNGRLGRMDTKRETRKAPFGPEGRDMRPIEDNNESEEE
jgi:hypothetical protein